MVILTKIRVHLNSIKNVNSDVHYFPSHNSFETNIATMKPTTMNIVIVDHKLNVKCYFRLFQSLA